MIEGIRIAPLKIIPTEGGDVLHALKSTDPEFQGFGEAYFSQVKQGAVKAWKRHRQMTLNLVVPIGRIKFVIFDDRSDSISKGEFDCIELSKEDYFRLSVPPMLWVGFKGIANEDSMLLNIANIPHDPKESDALNEKEIKYNWD